MISQKLKIILIIIFFILLGAGVGDVFAKNVCLQCHEKSLLQKKVIHQPLSKGNCTACHNPHVAPHEGLLKIDLASLCYSCHKEEAEAFSKGVVHDPVRRGECSTCHDPHSSNYKNLLRGTMTDSCFECHKGLQKKYKNTHKPYAKGQCSVCHKPHQADNHQLLTVAPEKLCRKCHTETEVNSVHKNYPVKIKTCLSCHNPHGSNNKSLVRDVRHAPFRKDCRECHKGGGGLVRQEVCLKCHEEIRGDLLTLHSHLTDNKGNSCINCHSPHAGDTKKLLKGKQRLVCRNCHEDTLRKHENTLFVHKVTENDCNSCHAVHGANQMALLKGDGNKVCLPCHKSQGQFSHPVGKEIIDPRNNQMTTCVSCHNPHGTNYKGQLKLSGQEDLCIQCHRM
jgi:predicted CXXCH cytochrome family protein